MKANRVGAEMIRFCRWIIPGGERIILAMKANRVGAKAIQSAARIY
jgi:hypothetical protein